MLYRQQFKNKGSRETGGIPNEERIDTQFRLVQGLRHLCRVLPQRRAQSIPPSRCADNDEERLVRKKEEQMSSDEELI